MRQLFLMFLLLVLSVVSANADESFVREYTYRASDNDSKVSARKAALQQLQALVIQEVGVEIQSSFDQKERLNNDEFSRTVEANYKTFSRAVTKTRIIKERWNGETFFIRAEIVVDPDGLTEKITEVVKEKSEGKGSCEALAAKVWPILQQADSADKYRQLSEIARASPFDATCHEWQYAVLRSMGHTIDAVYRAWLFEQLSVVDVNELWRFIPAVVRYAFGWKNDQRLSIKEWQQLVQASNRSDRAKTSLAGALSGRTEYLPSIGREIDHRVQSKATLKQQLLELVAAADEAPKSGSSLNKEQTLTLILPELADDQPDLMVEMYVETTLELSDPSGLVIPIVDFYMDIYSRRTPEPGNAELAEQALYKLLPSLDKTRKDIKLSSRERSQLYHLISQLEYYANKDRPAYQGKLDQIIRPHPEFWANLISKQKRGARDVTKNLWFTRYELPGERDMCSPVECAKQLFTDIIPRKQSVYTKYLEAYGSRAAEAENLVFRKLERLRLNRDSSYSGSMMRDLILTLGNIQTNNSKSLDMLIGYIDERGYGYHETVMKALVKIGPPAARRMMSQFNQHPAAAQRYMVKALAAMEPKSEIRKFLKTIPTKDDRMRFAVEDALFTLSD